MIKLFSILIIFLPVCSLADICMPASEVVESSEIVFSFVPMAADVLEGDLSPGWGSNQTWHMETQVDVYKVWRGKVSAQEVLVSESTFWYFGYEYVIATSRDKDGKLLILGCSPLITPDENDDSSSALLRESQREPLYQFQPRIYDKQE